MLDNATREQLGLREKQGFKVQDWSTSSEFWQFTILPHVYYVDGDGNHCPARPVKIIFTENSEDPTFENLEDTIFPDAETARTMTAKMAESNGRKCDIQILD